MKSYVPAVIEIGAVEFQASRLAVVVGSGPKRRVPEVL
jgi:hypothetical protein